VLKRAYVTLRAEEVPAVSRTSPRWRNVFAAAVYTGMRKGDCSGLKADVDRAARSPSRVRTTGPRRRAGTLTSVAAPLRAYLVEAIDSSTSDLVFPAPDGSMRSPEADPQKVLRHALARAGLVIGYDHVCRRCKGRGNDHTERHQDADERAALAAKGVI
jgi:integrase